jgi:hypothetical protein
MVPWAHDDGHFSLVVVETSKQHRAFAHYCSRGYALPSSVRRKLEELLVETEVKPLGLARQRSDDALDDSMFWVLTFAAYVRDLSTGSFGPEVMLPPCTEFTVIAGQAEADEMRKWLALLARRSLDHPGPPEPWFPEAWMEHLPPDGWFNARVEDKARGPYASDVSYSSGSEDGNEEGTLYSTEAVFPLVRDILDKAVDSDREAAEAGGYMPSRSESEGWLPCELSSFDDVRLEAECSDYAKVLLLLTSTQYPSLVAVEWREGGWRYVRLDSMCRCLPPTVQNKLDKADAREISSSGCPRGLPDGSDCALYVIAFVLYLSARHKPLSSMNRVDFSDVLPVDKPFKCKWEAKLLDYGMSPSEERGEDLAEPADVPLLPSSSLLPFPVESVLPRQVYGLARDDVHLQKMLRRVKTEESKDLGGMGSLWGRRQLERGPSVGATPDKVIDAPVVVIFRPSYLS